MALNVTFGIDLTYTRENLHCGAAIGLARAY